MKRRRYACNERHCENDIANNIINHMHKRREVVDPKVFLALSRMEWQKETLGTFPLSSHVRSICFFSTPPKPSMSLTSVQRYLLAIWWKMPYKQI